MSTDAAAALPIHPEQVDGDPALLRWRIPDRAVPFRGLVASAPGALGRMLSSGVLAGITLEPGAVLIRVGVGTSWRQLGGLVRTALLDALADPDGWRGQHLADDDVLCHAAHEVLDGPVGDTIRAHGGDLQIIDVRDGVVSLQLSGACAGCPSSEVTLTEGFERELRGRYPELVDVRTVEEKQRSLRDRLFLPLRRR